MHTNKIQLTNNYINPSTNHNFNTYIDIHLFCMPHHPRGRSGGEWVSPLRAAWGSHDTEFANWKEDKHINTIYFINHVRKRQQNKTSLGPTGPNPYVLHCRNSMFINKKTYEPYVCMLFGWWPQCLHGQFEVRLLFVNSLFSCHLVTSDLAL